jgi:hypothetical protein
LTGTNFFPSRKRCCAYCQTRTLTVQGEEVTEYYHRGVVCHLNGHQLALPLDVELLRPGEGEETAAKRLLERVVANYGRFFGAVAGDALYLDAPFINCCRKHGKHDVTAIVNFVLTLFIVYVLLQCFWQRNVKPALQRGIGTLISLAEELCRSLGPDCQAPWQSALARPP